MKLLRRLMSGMRSRYACQMSSFTESGICAPSRMPSISAMNAGSIISWVLVSPPSYLVRTSKPQLLHLLHEGVLFLCGLELREPLHRPVLEYSDPIVAVVSFSGKYGSSTRMLSNVARSAIVLALVRWSASFTRSSWRLAALALSLASRRHLHRTPQSRGCGPRSPVRPSPC